MRKFPIHIGLKALFGIGLLAASASPARADSSFDVETLSELYHITADRTVIHTHEKVKEAFGHVVVSAEGKRLACDYLWVDDNTKDIKARGNVVFVDKQTTVEAAELHFNMNTGFGSIFYGRVYNDIYQLRGQLIRRVGDGHYLTTEGEYSTCKDCPESWKLAARNVDLTMDGYAFMDGVFVKIKDIPTLYLPYLIVPVKTRRQTGLLFPRIGGSSSHGFIFVQPLFVVIDKHQDATIGFGNYADNGPRYEAQYRYKSYRGIEGQTNAFLTNDRTYDPQHNRGVIKSENEWPFAKNFGMRWRFYDVRDRDYVYDYPEDINTQTLNFQSLPDIESNLVVQAPFDDFFVSMEARRYVNLIYDDPIHFDAGTVQALPTVHVGTKERQIVGPVLGNFYGRFDNFTRRNGPFFDSDNNGIFNTNFASTTNLNLDRIREAKRTIIAPELSAPFSVGQYLSLAPAVQFNSLHYIFSLPPPNEALPATTTSYLRTKIDFSTVFEHVYNYDGETVSKVQHQLVPFLSMSYIPNVSRDPNHPFQQQIQLTDGPFDQFDVVPLTNSTNFLRFPQGKSLYYGFDSHVVRKKKRPEEIPRAYPYDLIPASEPKFYPRPYNRKQEIAIEADKAWDEFNPRYDLYQEVWTFSASQAYDLLEARDHPDNYKRAFSYLLATSDLNLDDKFSQHMEYRWYPALVMRPLNTDTEVVYEGQQWFTTSLTWYWKKLANLRKTHVFERSLALGLTLKDQPNPARNIGGTLNWSFNDFMNVQSTYDWDLNAQRQTDFLMNAMLTHPSECWGLAFHWDWLQSRLPKHGQIGFQLLLNLDGSGFIGTNKGQGNNSGSGGLF